MKATVVIPTRNPGKILGRVLRAAAAQRTPWPYEILVVDSGSTDGTLELCRQFPRVRIHEIEPAQFGHGRTRNLAVSLARSEFVAFLTHDAAPADEHWLAELVAAVEQADDIAGAFGRHIAYENASPFTRLELDQHFDGFRAEPIVRLADPERYRDDAGYRQFLHFYSDNNSCLRRSVWEKFPYPDVDFAEDQLWAQQVIEAGYAKAFADRAVVHHSHDFAFWEQVQRSYDESRAFRRLFGYRLVPRFRHVLKHTVHSVLRDLRQARRQLGMRDLGWIVRQPVISFCRYLGYYLGQEEKLPASVKSRLSRDKNMNRAAA